MCKYEIRVTFPMYRRNSIPDLTLLNTVYLIKKVLLFSYAQVNVLLIVVI